MTTYPKPSRAQVLAALDRFAVRHKVEPIRAGSEGRPWESGLRAIIDHHTAGTNSLAYLMNAGGRFPYVNTLIDRDGLVHVLSTRSCWGTGDGGPWPGVAKRDSLHLVGWSNEVESLGRKADFTAAQMESLGRVNAALVSLGVPLAHEVNHRDWTDGTGPVGGYPLPTAGRKVDTRYDTADLQANTKAYLKGTTPPPPVVTKPPPKPSRGYRQGRKVYSSKMRRGQTNSDSVWNLQIALMAKGYRIPDGPTDNYGPQTQAACRKFQEAQGWRGRDADGIAGPVTVKRLGLVWVNG